MPREMNALQPERDFQGELMRAFQHADKGRRLTGLWEYCATLLRQAEKIAYLKGFYRAHTGVQFCFLCGGQVVEPAKVACEDCVGRLQKGE